ncbi:acyltransferase domain-containing protein, partial [Thioclava sp. BHET1]
MIAAEDLPLDIAAENAPGNVTVSGPRDALERLVKSARKARIAGRMLPVSYPYHGRAIAVLEDALRADLADIQGRPGKTAFYCGFTGTRADDLMPDADYWWQNARRPVAFRAGVEALANDDFRLFLEISPRTVLRGYLRETLDALGSAAQVLETLDKPLAEQRSAAAVVRQIFASGGHVEEEVLLGLPQAFR